MRLVVPSLELEDAFFAFCNDYEQYDVENGQYYFEGRVSFSDYIQRLCDNVKGINLKDGYVPCSCFWFMKNDNTIIGAIRIRHNIASEFLEVEGGHIGYYIAPSYRGQGYGKTMLCLALPKAKALGIKRALITADEDNWPSRKVIEANGGELENIRLGKVFPKPVARYWITL